MEGTFRLRKHSTFPERISIQTLELHKAPPPERAGAGTGKCPKESKNDVAKTSSKNDTLETQAPQRLVRDPSGKGRDPRI